ncbi:MAG: phenylalanine--tRNA ligase subunit beta, partial [Ignavibacteriaceae bacterium]
LTELKNLNIKRKRFTEPLKYPKIIRDIAFIFDESVKYLDIKDFIKKKSSQLLKEVSVFDLFESELLGQGKKSIAFTLEYYDYNRTLTEEEVEKDFNNLITLVSKEFNAQLRGK